MKYFLAAILTFLAAVAGAQETTSVSPALSPAQENSRKARTLLDQAIQALGGPAYLSIQDISQEGRTYSFHHGEPNSLAGSRANSR